MIDDSIMVSIAVPIYNTEQYLNDCLNSIINQKYKNIQILLINDGSTDDSLNICEDFANNDERIEIISKENGGLSSARNLAIENAKGKYLLFIDSDDYIKTNTVLELVTVAEREKADIVFFEANSFIDNTENSQFGLRELKRKKKYCTINGTTQFLFLENNNEFFSCIPLHFYKLEYLNKNKIRFLNGVIHEDELFSLQSYLCNGMVAHCHKSLYERRIRSNSIMTSRNDSVKLLRYNSGYNIYFAYHKFVNSHKISNSVKKISAFRIINMPLLYFKKMNDTQKSENYLKHKKLKRHILFHYGLSDYRLAKMCSGKTINKTINMLLKLRILKEKT